MDAGAAGTAVAADVSVEGAAAAAAGAVAGAVVVSGVAGAAVAGAGVPGFGSAVAVSGLDWPQPERTVATTQTLARVTIVFFIESRE